MNYNLNFLAKYCVDHMKEIEDSDREKENSPKRNEFYSYATVLEKIVKHCLTTKAEKAGRIYESDEELLEDYGKFVATNYDTMGVNDDFVVEQDILEAISNFDYDNITHHWFGKYLDTINDVKMDKSLDLDQIELSSEEIFLPDPDDYFSKEYDANREGDLSFDANEVNKVTKITRAKADREKVINKAIGSINIDSDLNADTSLHAFKEFFDIDANFKPNDPKNVKSEKNIYKEELENSCKLIKEINKTYSQRNIFSRIFAHFGVGVAGKELDAINKMKDYLVNTKGVDEKKLNNAIEDTSANQQEFVKLTKDYSILYPSVEELEKHNKDEYVKLRSADMKLNSFKHIQSQIANDSKEKVVEKVEQNPNKSLENNLNDSFSL